MFKHDDAEVDKEKTFYDFFNFRFLTHHYRNCTDFKTKLYNVTKSLTPLPSHELPFSENPPVAKEELKALQYFFLHFPCHKGSSLSQSLDPLPLRDILYDGPHFSKAQILESKTVLLIIKSLTHQFQTNLSRLFVKMKAMKGENRP